jgi:hypothetical protein
LLSISEVQQFSQEHRFSSYYLADLEILMPQMYRLPSLSTKQRKSLLRKRNTNLKSVCRILSKINEPIAAIIVLRLIKDI